MADRGPLLPLQPAGDLLRTPLLLQQLLDQLPSLPGNPRSHTGRKPFHLPDRGDKPSGPGCAAAPARWCFYGSQPRVQSETSCVGSSARISGIVLHGQAVYSS